MTIECYYKTCPYHSVEDGPFCYETECKVLDDDDLMQMLKDYRELERQQYGLMDEISDYCKLNDIGKKK